MKKLKELNLSVGTGQPYYPGSKTHVNIGYTGGVTNGADSSFSRRSQAVYNPDDFDEYSEDEIDSEDEMILEKRSYKNGKYNLVETLERLSEKAKPDFLDLDGDGDKKETMKKAAKDKEKGKKDEMHHGHLDEESFEEIDLAEFSSAGAISGPALPVGMSPKDKPDGKHIRMSEREKIVKEQIERMRILESYHQRTSNRLK